MTVALAYVDHESKHAYIAADSCASHIEYLCNKYEETKDDSFIENILGLVRGYDKASQKFIQVFRDLDQLWIDLEGSDKK